MTVPSVRAWQVIDRPEVNSVTLKFRISPDRNLSLPWLPSIKVPRRRTQSRALSQSGHPWTSAHRRQMAVGLAVVS